MYVTRGACIIIENTRPHAVASGLRTVTSGVFVRRGSAPDSRGPDCPRSVVPHGMTMSVQRTSVLRTFGCVDVVCVCVPVRSRPDDCRGRANKSSSASHVPLYKCVSQKPHHRPTKHKTAASAAARPWAPRGNLCRYRRLPRAQRSNSASLPCRDARCQPCRCRLHFHRNLSGWYSHDSSNLRIDVAPTMMSAVFLRRLKTFCCT